MLGEHAWEEILREIRSVSHDLLLLLEEIYDEDQYSCSADGSTTDSCVHMPTATQHSTVDTEPGAVSHESTTHTH